MNLGLLGDDPDLLHFAHAAQHAGARVVAAAVPERLASLLRQMAPAVRIEPDWELPLAGVEFDAIIVGGESPAIAAEAAVVGARRPVLALPRARLAFELAYRLDVELEDRRQAWPAFLHRFSPAVSEFLERFEQGAIGNIVLLRLDRTLRPEGAQQGRLQREQLDDAFLCDVDLLRLIGGQYRTLTATEIGSEGGSALQASVTLRGDAVPEAIWHAAAGDAPGWRLTITGDRGTAVIESAAAKPIALQLNGTPVDVPDADCRVRCVEQFVLACRRPGEASEQKWLPTWDDCVRAVDLLDGMHRSLRRRRTIDLHFGTVSERGQFKTQMTAVGCGVLLWTMLGTIAGLAAGKLLDPREPIERRAAAAGTVLLAEDFSRQGELEPESRARLTSRIAQQGAEAIILIDAAAGDRNHEAARRDSVAAAVDELDLAAPPQIDVRPLAGRGFHRLMMVVWLLIFGPLGLFLALQGFIVLTRHRP